MESELTSRQNAAPHSFLFGHLLEAKEAFDKLPPKAHSLYFVASMGRNFSNGAFYMDTYPLFAPLLVVTNPRLANEVVNHNVVGVRKPPGLRQWAHFISGGPTYFDSNGHAWKHRMSIFNPAFSTSNIMAEVPLIIDRVHIFKQLLKERSQTGKEFALEQMTLRLVADIISEFLLNLKTDSQRQKHPFVEAMIRQLTLKDTAQQPHNIVLPVNPSLRYRDWKNTRVLNREIQVQLNRRFRALKEARKAGLSNDTEFKAVMDLAIDEYLSRPANAARDSLDKEFLTQATWNMRMMFFNGYDSTGASIAHCIYMIYSHPEVLQKMRAEHDAILGFNAAAAEEKILRDPAVLNSLPYTLAVIKEVMRIFPPAGSIREGSKDLVLVDDDGTEYPTDGFAIQVLHWPMQQDERWWTRPAEFIPERFLVEAGHELYPQKDAWRVFEYGPRACPGQQMVLTKIKAVLACLVREFDFFDFYKGSEGHAQLDLSGVGGQRAYLVEAGAAHPTEGVPCKVSPRKN
ncbi:putative sterigmatocystin biosynthesis P450 monooxygenase stcS [Paramyrothecium foliicola]|nr:putative sterigmatocystin biosynthesis P450 monooxygenase stcS [Paramyrothecium foliicola]